MKKQFSSPVFALACWGLLSLGCISSSSPPRSSSGLATRDRKEQTMSTAELKAEDLQEGKGPAAKAGDVVEVHYTGWLADGKKFQSSRDFDKPLSFKLGAGEVIKGWDRGVVGMKVGGKRKLTIPPELAYGTRGKGPIPPDSTLVFEIELLKIK